MDLLDRAMALIADDLLDPELTPATIAKRLHVSRAGLYAAFGEEGGVSAIIQQKRLDAALKMLVRERPTHGLVKATAERCTFKSVAHLSRAFSARFGRAPADVVASSHQRVGGATLAE